jgi:hypothetical protein
MSGSLRHIIKKTDMDGFEEIKWSWPKKGKGVFFVL